MDITPSTNTNITSNPNKIYPDADSETPTRVLQPTKHFSSSNGVLKRHNPHHNLSIAAKPVVVSYKECLKNHAASLGGHALDGCGEFMPSPTATQTDPTSLKCAACGCHRNFHRREPEEPFSSNNPITHLIEYKPHHRHHPPPPPQGNRSSNSASPPPISSSYYPSSAPHMLLSLSTGLSAPQDNNNHHHVASAGAVITTRKRFRTKFSQDQKEKMHQFAERVGWKIQKRDEEIVNEFCNEIGVDKGVLKVWMHNNKNTSSKKDFNGGTTGMNLILDQIYNDNSTNGHGNGNNAQNDDEQHDRGLEAINGSSSSS